MVPLGRSKEKYAILPKRAKRLKLRFNAEHLNKYKTCDSARIRL